ncbi:hypothetical protein [Bradyrhizobium canariense]|uniref:Uncharacterized protein n=1 Tax=Bradyrhizobium canariense TaxID=255045 RepID=A0A1H1Q385_9BRAD|nr:hypothetical protein [Bradyrhizobium canariense]SDS17856.1 hypothetical protein SAMN05444158_1251 [Bradyrhizobium canariense]
MTEPDVLERSIREHQEWQRVAWQHLSRPSLTTFESRELRNQIKQSGTELRRYLAMRSERFRFGIKSRENDASPSINLN